MGVLSNSQDDATRLWIAARGLQAAVTLAFVLLARVTSRRSPTRWPSRSSAAVTLIALLSVFWWNVFPLCFVPGVGVTPFKKASEYVISAVFAVSVDPAVALKPDTMNQEGTRPCCAPLSPSPSQASSSSPCTSAPTGCRTSSATTEDRRFLPGLPGALRRARSAAAWPSWRSCRRAKTRLETSETELLEGQPFQGQVLLHPRARPAQSHQRPGVGSPSSWPSATTSSSRRGSGSSAGCSTTGRRRARSSWSASCSGRARRRGASRSVLRASGSRSCAKELSGCRAPRRRARRSASPRRCPLMPSPMRMRTWWPPCCATSSPTR